MGWCCRRLMAATTNRFGDPWWQPVIGGCAGPPNTFSSCRTTTVEQHFFLLLLLIFFIFLLFCKNICQVFVFQKHYTKFCETNFHLLTSTRNISFSNVASIKLIFKFYLFQNSKTLFKTLPNGLKLCSY